MDVPAQRTISEDCPEPRSVSECEGAHALRGKPRGIALHAMLCVACVTPLVNAVPRDAELTVSPAELLPITAGMGSPPQAAEIEFTVQRSRPGVLKWAVSVDAHWLELSTDGGVVRPHQESSTVIARVRDVSALPVGRYTGNVVFTSGRNYPPVLRRVVLYVHFPPPVLLPQPTFNGQATNVVSWTAVAGANQYELQVSTTRQFTNAFSSGWLDYATNYSLTGLQSGVAYFYRVRCRSNHVAWSQTLGHEFAQNENMNLSTFMSPGQLVLAGNTNRIWIENFDEPGTNWSDTIFELSYVPDDPGFGRGEQNASTRAPDTHPPLPINGGDDKEAHLGNARFFHRYAYTENNYGNHVDDVTVDAYVARSQGASWVEAGLVLRGEPAPNDWLVGGNGYFAQVVMGNTDYHWLRFGYLSNSTLHGLGSFNPDVGFAVESADANYHLRYSARGEEITVRVWSVVATNGIIRESAVRFLGNGTNVLSVRDSRYNSGLVGLTGSASAVNRLDTDYAFFDDITIQAHEFPAQYVPVGSSIARVARPSWVDHWGELQWNGESGPNTGLSIDVLDENGIVLAANVANAMDLDGMPTIATQRSLLLRANFSTADSGRTPVLSDWTVTFPEPAENATASAWSDFVHSTLDLDAPVMAITSPEEGAITFTNVFTVSGTAFDAVSGVANVRALAGTVIASAATTNAFANWTLAVALPRRGTNTIYVGAADNAQPPNFAVLRRIIVYAP